jgi:dipeptidyl aminopeptidase/acylaminoacyl peptidase
MLAVDQVIAMGFVDDKNMGVGGGSYGGFMTSWVVGHTDRFRAAVAMRSVNNWVSFHGTSDIGFTFTENEIKGNPWDQMETLIKHSPFTYVKNVVTPLLILHGEQDHRCPIEQGEQMFAALKKLKREVEFVRFPGESHDMSRSGKPHHRVERLERILSWFDRWFR